MILRDRLFRLFYKTEEQSHLAEQIQDLRHTLFSAIQEIEVLKSMLREQGAWDEQKYRRHRIAQMLSDHSSAGASPWRSHSYFKYVLDEFEFLRDQLNMGEQEVEKFRDDAAALERQT